MSLSKDILALACFIARPNQSEFMLVSSNTEPFEIPLTQFQISYSANDLNSKVNANK